jgi:phosphoenolpyruvate carboxykinase (GTP)
MLELRKGVDILGEVGGITTIEGARAVFEHKMDKESLDRIGKVRNEDALLRIANAIAMCEPDRAWVNTGSEADRATIRRWSIEKGEEAALAMDGHTIHFDLAKEQGRIVDRTFYIVNEDEDISVLALKILRSEAHEHVKRWMKGIARGKTLMIGFFNRGPAGAPATLPALETCRTPGCSWTAAG